MLYSTTITILRHTRLYYAVLHNSRNSIRCYTVQLNTVQCYNMRCYTRSTSVSDCPTLHYVTPHQHVEVAINAFQCDQERHSLY
jgi:hypothetical protein